MPARKSKKYAENPFLASLALESTTRMKKIVSPLNDQSSLLVVNKNDGEIQANASAAIAIRHEVESNEFCKIYAKGVGAMFGLSRSGQKIFGLLFSALAGADGKEKDIVTLYYPALSDEIKQEISYRVFTDGINNLIKQQFLAETIVPHQYFINPCFIFNGDRLAIIHIYERKGTTDKVVGEAPEEKALESVHDVSLAEKNWI